MSEIDNQPALTGSFQQSAAPIVPATPINVPVLEPEEVVLEMGDNFDLDGFQIVRKEFFAHLREPSVSFNNCKFSVNSACLSKFPMTEYVQVMINRNTKILALRPCAEGARDSFAWCSASKGKRKPRAITCKLFFAKVVDLMGWNPNYKYKLLGRLIHANGEYLIAFDLHSTEVYQRTEVEGQKPKVSRQPVYPAGWQDQFGLPFNEHSQSMQINIFDGYAVYSIKDKAASDKESGENTQPLTVAPAEPLQATFLPVHL